jgi:hypothetical protein
MSQKSYKMTPEVAASIVCVEPLFQKIKKLKGEVNSTCFLPA